LEIRGCSTHGLRKTGQTAIIPPKKGEVPDYEKYLDSSLFALNNKEKPKVKKWVRTTVH
jgi:hypothetical protein